MTTTLMERTCRSAAPPARFRWILPIAPRGGAPTTVSSYKLKPKKELFCLLVLFLCAPTLYADNVFERQFIWNEANSKMASAGTQEDFLLAAEVYRKFLDTGVRNGPLFYNLGTALLMAKRYDDAMNAFLRAERYMGSSWDIKRNMLIAAAGEEKDETVSLPWYRVPMFWHFGLAVSTRMTISVYAFMAFWLSLILRSLDSRRLYRPLMILSLIVLVMFGSSVLTTLESEARDQRSAAVVPSASQPRDYGGQGGQLVQPRLVPP